MDFKIPFLGDGIKKGDVVKVFVKAGDAVKKDQPLFELETDKAVAEVPAEFDGTITNVLIQSGDKVEVDQVVMSYEGGATSTPVAVAPVATDVKPAPIVAADVVKAEAVAPPIPPAEARGDILPAGPSVRRFARELGVDLSRVQGSGPRGRISIEDVKAFVKSGMQGGVKVLHDDIPVLLALPDLAKWGPVRREPMSGVRRATANKLSRDWSSGPQVTQFDEADVTKLEVLRKKFAPHVEKSGGALTVTSILIKISAAALNVFPKFRGSLDFQTEEVVYKDYTNIGVAVDTERGLLVPVIRDVNLKNLTQVSIELTELGRKARDRKLTLEEMQGSVFTISNLGGIGGTGFTPIVNQPDAAILGVSRTQMKPVWNGKEFEPRRILPLSLSYDHRLIDGADAARFLRWICEALEEPFVLTLEG